MSNEELQRLSTSLAAHPDGSQKPPVQGFVLLRQYRSPVEATFNSDYYFSVHWAVLHSSHMFLFDNSSSRSCRRAICLPTFTMQTTQPRDNRLWPNCSSFFSLSSAEEVLQFGCAVGQPDRKWPKRLSPYVAQSSATSREPEAVAEAQRRLQELLKAVAEWQLQQESQKQQQQQQQQHSDESEYDAGNQYLAAGDDPGGSQSLADLLEAGESSSFAFDFVSKTMYTGDKEEDDLWEMMEDTENGTFMLLGFHGNAQQQQKQQLVVNHNGVVHFIPLSVEADNKLSINNGLNEIIFDCVEALVFYYLLHDVVVPGDRIRLQQPLGYGVLRRTQLFTASLWHLSDKDLCNRVLATAPPGTYALRRSAANAFTLTVHTQAIGAKLLLRRLRLRDRTEFCLDPLGWRYDSLEQLLEDLHHRPFPIYLNRAQFDVILGLPYQVVGACKAQLQSQLYAPLRSAIFYRGSWERTHSLLLQATPRQFVVWVSPDAGTHLLVQLPRGEVAQYRICLQQTQLRCLPQRMYFLEQRPQLRFDCVEGLIAHLQSHAEPLKPQMNDCLLQPLNR